MTMMTKQSPPAQQVERINHPAHYGGADNPHEPIKVIRHYKLNFELGCVIKYVLRAPYKGAALEDLKKAAWYLQGEIAEHEKFATREAQALDATPTTTVDSSFISTMLRNLETRQNGLQEKPDESIKVEVSNGSHRTCQECIKPVEEADDALCDGCFKNRYGRDKVRSTPDQ